MKVLHLLAGAGWGGAERIACAIAERGRSAGHTVAIEATPECIPGPESEGIERLAGDNERIDPGLDRRRSLWAWANDARLRVARFRPDLIHAHLATPAFAAAVKRASGSFPSIWSLHLLPFGKWPFDFMARVPSAWVVELFARDALLVAVSRSDASTLTEKFGARRVRCVVNAPPAPAFEPEPIDRTAWGGARSALLFVGRLDEQKGLDRLIRAMSEPPMWDADARLLVVGDGPRRPELTALVRERGAEDRVLFIGARPAGSAIRSADLVVSPSRYEGMPLVPMEAILASVPVLASPIAPHRELLGKISDSLLPDEETLWPARLFDFCEHPERRAAIATAQAGLRPALTIERVVREYEALYHELVGEHRVMAPC